MRKKVALVLGGGAALGFAHLGVLKVLEENKIPVDIIVGTSMGALIGAVYCSGAKLDDMSAFASKFRTRDFFDVNFNASGLFSGKGVMRFIGKILPDVQIENLSKTFACVACDLNTEKEIVFKTGSLRNAVRSSMSIPGIFVPVSIDDMLLVDGGIINNLPEDVAMEMGADVIISVDVMSNYHMKNKPRNIVDSIFASMNIQTKEVQRLKSCYSDIVLTPDTSNLSQMKFGKETVVNAINAGIEETNKHIKEIKKLIK